MRDLRDPNELGLKLLATAKQNKMTVRMVYASGAIHVQDYDHNPGPIEKYGDPRKLPSTMP